MVTAPPREAIYQRTPLYPKQQAAIFTPARIAVVEASTKAGKTYACVVWLFEQALAGGRGRNYWWVAPIYAQAKIAYRRLKRTLPPLIATPNETELTLTLANGAVLWFKGAEHPDSLYGEDVYAAVIDEASRVREESWHAVRSTLTATRGPLRIIGNVRGRKNWAYQLARRAEAGDPGLAYAKLTAYDAVEAGVLAAEEIVEAERLLPAHVFRELYLAEPVDDDSNPFGLDAIIAAVAPLSAAPVVVFGADLARKQDWTVIIGLDAEGSVCHLARFQRPWSETVATLLSLPDVPLLLDATGVGDPVLDQLQRRKGQVEGFLFSARSKQQLLEGLALALSEGRLRFPDGVIRAELEAMTYRYTRTGVSYEPMEGMHDDAVMALALAWQQFSHRPHRPRIVAPGGFTRAVAGRPT